MAGMWSRALAGPVARMIVDLDSRRASACLEDAVGYAGIEKRHTRACAVWPACCHNGSRGRQGSIDQGSGGRDGRCALRVARRRRFNFARPVCADDRACLSGRASCLPPILKPGPFARPLSVRRSLPAHSPYPSTPLPAPSPKQCRPPSASSSPSSPSSRPHSPPSRRTPSPYVPRVGSLEKSANSCIFRSSSRTSSAGSLRRG
ncbi:hypothetical protein OH76DRAFT_1227299 [Lentinus brumalis]|uniref:Uncharacterized protein n=1 Tax=Lentinus brumalis TaxID=2498619 RepID=A0A371DLV9_9APHY|nr:hypothetical protein OH76DRAFT_1227299 [Polyporus brumalis]